MTQFSIAVEYLREKAAEYRRQAQLIAAPKPAARLLALAQEYETQLQKFETRQVVQSTRRVRRDAR
jgi:hypothetical protein